MSSGDVQMQDLRDAPVDDMCDLHNGLAHDEGSDVIKNGIIAWKKILLPEKVFDPEAPPPVSMPPSFPVGPYESVRALYEAQRLARVICNEYNGYLLRNGDGSCTQVTHRDLKEKFAEQKYTEETVVDGEGTVARKQFIQTYILDDEKFVYAGMSYDPRNSNPYAIRMVAQIRAEGLPRVITDVDSFMAPLLEYSAYLFEDIAQRDYFWAYLAHLVQYPATKTGVALVLQGRQGVGKNIMLAWFAERVLGPALSYQCGWVASVFHTHSVAHNGRVLLMLDEVSRAECVANKDNMKNLITTDKMVVNEKHKGILRVHNMVNVIMTTNNSKTVVVEQDDRRYCFLDCWESKREDKAYFKGLAMHMAQTGGARAMYEFLMAMDISEYVMSGWSAMRPMSFRHEQAKQANMTPVMAFLNWWCGYGHKLQRVESPKKGAYNVFKSFMEDVQFSGWKRDKWSYDEFAAEMKEIHMSSKKVLDITRNKHTSVYRFSPSVLRAYLEEHGGFSETFYELGVSGGDTSPSG